MPLVKLVEHDAADAGTQSSSHRGNRIAGAHTDRDRLACRVDLHTIARDRRAEAAKLLRIDLIDRAIGNEQAVAEFEGLGSTPDDLARRPVIVIGILSDEGDGRGCGTTQRSVAREPADGVPDPVDLRVRVRQELLLGVGGVRALRALNIDPGVLHLNEGHSAFAGLELIRERMPAEGVGFAEALKRVAGQTVFTTHTPIPAGHDRFPPDLVEEHLGPLRDAGR